MAAVIYSESQFIALCRVHHHSERELEPLSIPRPGNVPLTLARKEHHWELEVLAILQQGINARIAPDEQLKPGSVVNLHGTGKGGGLMAWEVDTTDRKSVVAYFPPDHEIHALLADALTLLTEEEKSTLLEEPVCVQK